MTGTSAHPADLEELVGYFSIPSMASSAIDTLSTTVRVRGLKAMPLCSRLVTAEEEDKRHRARSRQASGEARLISSTSVRKLTLVPVVLSI